MKANTQYTMTFQVNDKPGELISSMKPNAYTEGKFWINAQLMPGPDNISFYISDKTGTQWCVALSQIQYLRSQGIYFLAMGLNSCINSLCYTVSVQMNLANEEIITMTFTQGLRIRFGQRLAEVRSSDLSPGATSHVERHFRFPTSRPIIDWRLSEREMNACNVKSRVVYIELTALATV